MTCCTSNVNPPARFHGYEHGDQDKRVQLGCLHASAVAPIELLPWCIVADATPAEYPPKDFYYRHTYASLMLSSGHSANFVSN